MNCHLANLFAQSVDVTVIVDSLQANKAVAALATVLNYPIVFIVGHVAYELPTYKQKAVR